MVCPGKSLKTYRALLHCYKLFPKHPQKLLCELHFPIYTDPNCHSICLNTPMSLEINSKLICCPSYYPQTNYRDHIKQISPVRTCYLWFSPIEFPLIPNWQELKVITMGLSEGLLCYSILDNICHIDLASQWRLITKRSFFQIKFILLQV